ncbi:unnamed protein product [Citrullus colocynthis]|uniref:Uncharacterized protein n=1 Tax=Citrullus colocynthis TaxID=252529 RepID=A0ABP0YFW7_9ROSI
MGFAIAEEKSSFYSFILNESLSIYQIPKKPIDPISLYIIWLLNLLGRQIAYPVEVQLGLGEAIECALSSPSANSNVA